MKNKRGSGVMTAEDYKPKSRMHMEGEQAKTVKEHPIGRKVKFTVSATKTGHNVNSDGSHSAQYEIHKVEGIDNEATDKKEADESIAEKPRNKE